MHITFHGAVAGVTGSCHVLHTKDASGTPRQFLVDCGMFQGRCYAELCNNDAFGFDPKTIDAVFITHPHADHTGRLPKLVNEGYRGPVYMTPPCEELTKLVLQDAYVVMEENARRNNEPLLYTREDLAAVFGQFRSIDYRESLIENPGITVTFRDAGHVLGSAFITFHAEGKTVVFSGDIGNNDVPILPKTESIPTADAVVCESTYGGRVHEDVSERGAKLKHYISQTLNQGGVLMIPAFSIERTQELLYELNNLLLHDLKTTVPIFLDSPMAIKATAFYRKFKNYLRFDAPGFTDPDGDFFRFPNLHETATVQESKTINDAHGPKIIIAGSGMMSGGRIMHHLVRYLPDSRNMVLVIGYQAEGTLGRKIYEGAKEVTIYGEKVQVRASIEAIGAFSAHGDRNKLTTWLKPQDGRMPKVLLVHGEGDTKIDFADHLRTELKTEVVIPTLNTPFEI